MPPTVRPVLRDRTLVTIPRSRRSAINRLRLPSSKYRRKMVRTRSASSSTTTILRSLVAYPSGSYAADPETLALGGRNLVADALGGHLTLELGKRQQDIERQPPHRCRGIELLRDRDERYVMAIEQLHELGKVRQRAGQA